VFITMLTEQRVESSVDFKDTGQGQISLLQDG
jgi:hypothetical protein